MSSSIHEANIDFLVIRRTRFPHVLWSSGPVKWQAANKRCVVHNYVAAQVSDSLTIWLFSDRAGYVRNKIQGFYDGWPLEIRATATASRPSGIDYLGITREVVGVGSN